MNMETNWKTLATLDEIHAAAQRLGAEDPVVHNLLCSFLLRLETPKPVHLRTPTEVAFATETNLILSHLEFEGLLDLAHFFEGVDFPGVVGPLDAAEGFVEAYAAVVGVRPQKWIYQMIYRCDELNPPAPPSGKPRLLTLDDESWFPDALKLFNDEALPHQGFDVEKFKLTLPALVEMKRFHIWENEGVPCAYAALSGLTPWSQRIGPVHTLPEHRGKGYGSAITAHLTKLITESGRIPCLYTDLSNPTSNSIYVKMGYREVARSLNAVYRIK